MSNIRRNKLGHITGECMREMENSLPIELFVNQDTEPCYIAHTKNELAHYFDGAIPYVLTTRYKKSRRMAGCHPPAYEKKL
jgi:hypothetical protein